MKRIPRTNIFPGSGPLVAELTRRDAEVAAGVNALAAMFELTSNTNLRISVTGTDGVTRSVNLTLS